MSIILRPTQNSTSERNGLDGDEQEGLRQATMFVESKPIDGTDSDSLPLPFDSILFSIDV
jgi:hypothetical protein